MADRVVMDTDALVGLLRGDEGWKRRIAALRPGGRLLTTDINAFELYLGAHLSQRSERNLAAAKGLLNTLTLLHMSGDAMEVAARIAADLRARGEPLDVKDILIAAVALVHGAAVLTGNREHFRRVEGLAVLPTESNGTDPGHR